jgi:hypothetical protein
MWKFIAKALASVALGGGIALILMSGAARADAFAAEHISPVMSFAGLIIGVLAFAGGAVAMWRIDEAHPENI